MNQAKPAKPKKRIKKPNLLSALLTSPGVVLVPPLLSLWSLNSQSSQQRNATLAVPTPTDGTTTITNPDGSTTTSSPLPTISPEAQRAFDLSMQEAARQGLSPKYDSVPVLQTNMPTNIPMPSQNILLDFSTMETAQEKFSEFKANYEKVMARYDKRSDVRISVEYVPPRNSANPALVTFYYGTVAYVKRPLTVTDPDTNAVWMENAGQLTLADKSQKIVEYLFSTAPPPNCEEAKQMADQFYLQKFKAGDGKIVGQRVGSLLSPTDELISVRQIHWTDEAAKATFPE